MVIREARQMSSHNGGSWICRGASQDSDREARVGRMGGRDGVGVAGAS